MVSEGFFEGFQFLTEFDLIFSVDLTADLHSLQDRNLVADLASFETDREMIVANKLRG